MLSVYHILKSEASFGVLDPNRNKFKEFSEQSETSGYDFKRPKIPLKQRMQQNTIKS